MLTWGQNSSESERCKRHIWSRNYAGDDGVGISPSLLLIYTKLTATIAKLLPKQPQEEEESNGGTAIMEAKIIVQERDHNDVFAERDHSSSIASGLSLLCFFSLQIVHLSPQFRSRSLSLGLIFRLSWRSSDVSANEEQVVTWVFCIFAKHADPSSKFPDFLKNFGVLD